MSAYLRLAPVCYDVSLDLPPGHLEKEESYQGFFDDTPPIGSEDIWVSVRGHYTGLPHIPLKKADLVFASETFWDVYKSDSRPTFILNGRDFQGPYGTAVFSDDYRTGDIYFREPDFWTGAGLVPPYPLNHPVSHLHMISLLSRGYGLSIHGYGIVDQGKGYLFTGSSGAGKSTMARLWGDEAQVLNDERIIIGLRQGKFWIFGTPWLGELGVCSPGRAPLEKLFFIEHGENNRLVQRSGANTATSLLSHCVLPYWEREGMDFTLELCARLVKEVPCFDLSFKRDKKIIDFIRCGN